MMDPVSESDDTRRNSASRYEPGAVFFCGRVGPTCYISKLSLEDYCEQVIRSTRSLVDSLADQMSIQEWGFSIALIPQSKPIIEIETLPRQIPQGNRTSISFSVSGLNGT